ncbi:hypothetical protein AAT18_01390 [Rhodococcus aetherivorans]|nr:hypothetical protein AAT18_01390 [Rhodococcus aetherivorans]
MVHGGAAELVVVGGVLAADDSSAPHWARVITFGPDPPTGPAMSSERGVGAARPGLMSTALTSSAAARAGSWACNGRDDDAGA